MVFSPESCEREPLCANDNELSQPYQENGFSSQYVVSNEPEDSDRTVQGNFTTLMPAREDDSNPM